MQDIIKINQLYCKPKCRKTCDFGEYYSPNFKRIIYEGYLSSKDPHDEQSKFSNKLKNIDKGIKSVGQLFISTIVLLSNAWKDILNRFKTRLFPIKNQ